MKTLTVPVKIILLAGLYVVSGWIGFQFIDPQSHVTLIWPPSGIALALLFIWGIESWPGVFLGSLALGFYTTSNPAFALVATVGNTLEVVISFYVLRRLGFQRDFRRVRDVFLLGVTTVSTGTFISATIGYIALSWWGMLPAGQHSFYSWIEWWLGNEAGTLIFVPLLLAWRFYPPLRYTRSEVMSRIILGGTSIMVTILVFFIPGAEYSGLDHLIFPFLLWMALYFQVNEIVTITFIVSVLAALGTANGSGPYTHSEPHQNILLLWVFITTLNVTTMIIGLVSQERKATSQELQQERDFSTQITNALGLGVAVTNESRQFEFLNPAYAQMIGYTLPGELIGKTPRDVTWPDDRAILDQAHEDRYKGKTTTYETQLVHKDGHLLNALITGSPRWENGRVVGTIAVIADVTERKQMENALRDSEQRLRAIFDNAPVGIMMADTDGTLIDINDTYLDIVGAPPGIREQLINRINLDDVDMFKKAGIHDHFVRLRQHGKSFSVDATVTSMFGRERVLHYQGAPIMNVSDRINGGVITVEDISWRKESESKLKAAHDTLDRLIQQLPNGIQVFDSTGLCTDVNSAHLDLFGTTRERLIGIFNIFNDPLSEQTGTAQGLRLALTGEVVELGDIEFNFDQGDVSFVGRQGKHIINVTFFPVYDDTGQITSVVALNHDVTERRQAEEALRHRNTELEALRSVALAVGSSLKLEEVLAELLTQLEKLVPYVSASIALVEDERLHFVAQRGIPEDFDLAQVEDIINSQDTFRFVDQPVIFKDVRQETNWVSIPGYQEYIRSWMGISLIHRGEIIGILNLDYDKPNFYTPMHADLASAVAQQAALAIEHARLYGNLEHLVYERTKELETANQQLTESVVKLEEMDKLRAKFVADVSHELRTPLSVLNTRIYLLERAGPENQAKYLPGLKEQIERLTTFVETILDLSRLEVLRESITLLPVDLNSAAEQVITHIRPRAEISNLSLTFLPDPTVPTVKADHNQILQVITNLVANAINYTQQGGVHIATGFDPQRNKVWLKVQDTGVGITEEDRPHVFERFYRGKRAGSSSIPGTGLGLSIIKEIMSIHNGDVILESEVGVGTTFTIWLPVCES
ncbi:MAG: PAS domain S-box protein [Anaerolineaceae bacterium]|nr:PAS domain S-box protein [Anaerolineaceae bacterium]